MIFLVNGIRRSVPTTTGPLACALSARGHNTVIGRYPVAHWYTSGDRRRQFRDAGNLLRQVNAAAGGKPVHLVCHSHGCLLGSRMMEIGGAYPFGVVWMIAPALDAEWHWSHFGARQIHVVFNRHDRAIFAAHKLPFGHPWGSMGREGWKEPEFYAGPPVTNHEDGARSCLSRMHCHYFAPWRVGALAKMISDSLAGFDAPPDDY